ncbi:MAG: hypothetical protein GTO12_13920 [Proteobacteria bacterium]|nr:hypothetical protein [Pseudomonadota bacterium]
MALWNGVDLVAFASNGIFTKTYGSGNPGNIANLFAFYGFMEDAPGPAQGMWKLLKGLIKTIRGRSKFFFHASDSPKHKRLILKMNSFFGRF